MSVLTVGRVGLDVELSEVESWNISGDDVSVSGVLAADSLEDVKALRQQLNGYVGNGDEEVVPVTWSEDSTVDGFYRVTGVGVSTVPSSFFANWFEFSLKLERVAGFAAPMCESILIGALRTNDGGIAATSAQSWHAVPSSVDSYYDGGVSSTEALPRVGAEGSLRFFTKAGSPSPSFFSAKPRWHIGPEEFYQNAAKIELGSGMRTVVGRQIVNDPTSWRLSNGLVRVTPGAASGLNVSHYDGSLWLPPKDWEVSQFNSFTTTYVDLGDPLSIVVLRNSPEECVIRITYPFQDQQDAYLDLALRRGDRMVRGYLAAVPMPASTELVVRKLTAEAGTMITGNTGIRATANDAAGNRYVLAAADNTGFSTSPPYFRTTGSALSFAIGMEIGGSTATGQETAENLVYQYMSAQSERVTVVGR